jgi:hypothetical protein
LASFSVAQSLDFEQATYFQLIERAERPRSEFIVTTRRAPLQVVAPKS